MDESKHIELNVKKWDKWAPVADGPGWMYRYLRKSQDALIVLLPLAPNITFLDIGCGTGWAVGQVAKQVYEKGEFYGVDLSPKMVEKAKENFRDKNNFHFIQANSESIPLGNDLFDLIICTNSFHHYLHPEMAMKEIHRLLKKGGRIYILDPTADSWIIKVIDKMIKLLEPEHVKMYSTKEFKGLMLEAGLNYIETRSIEKEKVHVGEK